MRPTDYLEISSPLNFYGSLGLRILVAISPGLLSFVDAIVTLI